MTFSRAHARAPKRDVDAHPRPAKASSPVQHRTAEEAVLAARGRTQRLSQHGRGRGGRTRSQSGGRRRERVRKPRPLGGSPTHDARRRYLRARMLRMREPPCASFDIVTTLAGVGRRGKKDGELVGAYFDRPWDVCALPDGSMLVTDHTNNTLRHVCRRQRTVATLKCARMLAPRCPIVVDGQTVAVADSGHNKIRLLRLAREGATLTVETELPLAGTGRRGHKDGPAQFAMFNKPSGICMARDGSMLVADTGNHVIRRVYTKAGRRGRWVETLTGTHGQPGCVDGPGTIARLNRPTSVVVDAVGTILVCDSGSNAIRALHEPIEGLGDWQLTTVAGHPKGGFVDGEGCAARFNAPSGLCLDQVRAACARRQS